MRNFFLPIAIEGLPFIGVAILIGIIFWFFNIKWLSLTVLCIGIFIIYFFRDPQRSIVADNNDIISPADGKVIFIGTTKESEFTNELMTKISIFMSLFDVHINRAPFDGVVRDVRYKKGSFFAANKRNSDTNEHNAILMEIDKNTSIVVTQVAGLIARRIVFYPKIGTFLRRGERFGLIRFGSRVDIYLPKETELTIKTGDRVFGGKTLIARLVKK